MYGLPPFSEPHSTQLPPSTVCIHARHTLSLLVYTGDAVLLQFERAQEWADLIRYLARLQRTLNKYAQLPWIPDKALVAKRLYQCFNPALPSGVHLKTLETVELIFSRIGPHRLARSASLALLRVATAPHPLPHKHRRLRTTVVLLFWFQKVAPGGNLSA